MYAGFSWENLETTPGKLCRWDTIKMDFKEMGQVDANWIHLTQDR
jgi:hypothetical protein